MSEVKENQKVIEQNPWTVFKAIVNYSIAMTEAAIVDSEQERLDIGINMLNNSVNQFLEQIRTPQGVTEENVTEA